MQLMVPDLRGPRVFVVRLPSGLILLNSNDRRNRWVHAGLVKEIRTAAWAIAKQQKIPPLDRVHIVGEHRPVNVRVRDAANMYPSFKAAIDGIVQAGVLANDDDAHVDGPHMVTGPIDEAAKARRLRHGSIVLTLTELPTAP